MNGIALLTGGDVSATTTLTIDMFDDVINTLSSNITPELVLGVIGAIVTFSVVFVFMHWGTRKIVGAFMSAFGRGKLRV